MYDYSVCYVLTDSKELYYYNQMLISILSLRKKGFNGSVYVLMDYKTESYIRGAGRADIEDLEGQIIIVNVPDSISQVCKSRFIKTNLREYIEGDILYIDTDTVIADKLPEFICEHDLGFVQDRNWMQTDKPDEYVVPSSSQQMNYRLTLMRKCGYKWDNYSRYYNGGVIWMKDTKLCHDFFNKWHLEWKNCTNKGIYFDQPSLNYTNRKMGGVIFELEGEWNTQVTSPMALQFIQKAIIVHYFSKQRYAPYILSRPENQKHYRSEEIAKIIEHPREAFYPIHLQENDINIDDVMNSRLFDSLLYIYRNKPGIYKKLDNVVSWMINQKQKYKKLAQT